MKQKLFIISNESIYANNNKFFCDNIDLKSTPESLGKKFEINILARKSPRKRFHQIKLKKIQLFNNFNFTFHIFCMYFFEDYGENTISLFEKRWLWRIQSYTG